MNESMLFRSGDVKHNMKRIEQDNAYSEFIDMELARQVIGQPEATKAVASKICVAESGFNNPHKPYGVFLEIGPTGVGKTELAKATAKYLFKNEWEDRLKIINCAEFQEGHSINRLIGSPPSYVGYGDELAIPSQWLKSGKSVVVFDEIEKAHPKLHRFLLSVIDEGKSSARERAVDGVDEVALDFTESLIFLTSNAGSEVLKKQGQHQIGFHDNEIRVDFAKEAIKSLSNYFSPEFLGRVEIVPFRQLEPVHIREIYWKLIEDRNKDLFETYSNSAPFFSTTSEFRDFILEQVDISFGARNLASVIEKELFSPAASALSLPDVAGRPIVADREDDITYFYTDFDE